MVCLCRDRIRVNVNIPYHPVDVVRDDRRSMLCGEQHCSRNPPTKERPSPSSGLSKSMMMIGK